MNQTLITFAGVSITTAKTFSLIGLLFDICGVVLLVKNEIQTRKSEHTQAIAEALNIVGIKLHSESIKESARRLLVPEFAEGFFGKSAKATLSRRMYSAAKWGFGLVGTGFLLQLIGTVIS